MRVYFLGVDGGQSSTTALIGDDQGQVIGSARGGPCNHVSGEQARSRFLSVIGGCVRNALTQAGLPEDTPFDGACLGFSGGPADKEDLVRDLFRIRQALVTHDAFIALTGATAGAPGVIMIAGTGSIAFGRNAEGRTMRAGGWGYVYGDEGGGFDLTRRALRAALRAEEGWGPPTLLRELLLKSSGAADANDLLHRFYTPEFARQRIASMSKIVSEAAEQGDLVALQVLEEAAEQLAGYALSLRRALFGPKESVSFSYVGGVYRSEPLRSYFATLLQADKQHRVMAPIYGPAAGALMEAYRLAGLSLALTGVPEEKQTT